jgi:hypothetical protein
MRRHDSKSEHGRERQVRNQHGDNHYGQGGERLNARRFSQKYSASEGLAELALATKIVRPLESTVRYSPTPTGFPKIVSKGFPILQTARPEYPFREKKVAQLNWLH